MLRTNKVRQGYWDRGWSEARTALLDRVASLMTTGSEIRSKPLRYLEEEHFRKRKWWAQEPWGNKSDMFEGTSVSTTYKWGDDERDGVVRWPETRSNEAFWAMGRTWGLWWEAPRQGNTLFMISKGRKNFYYAKLWNTNNDLLWIIFIIYSFELSNVKISDSFQTFKFCLNFCLFLKMKRGDYNKLNLFVI